MGPSKADPARGIAVSSVMEGHTDPGWVSKRQVQGGAGGLNGVSPKLLPGKNMSSVWPNNPVFQENPEISILT